MQIFVFGFRTFLYFNSDLGCHIDGFIAVAAHTFIVGATKVDIIFKNVFF
jgi:hypothetical protein